jgi:hypothetical protein
MTLTLAGQKKNGKKCGYGEYTWKSGNSYKGEWKKDKKHGKGFFKWEDGYYDGEFRGDKKHGKGLYVVLDGAIYVSCHVSFFAKFWCRKEILQMTGLMDGAFVCFQAGTAMKENGKTTCDTERGAGKPSMERNT